MAHVSHKVHIQAATKEIDAVDVDPFYVPLPPQTVHPALCVYIAPAKIGPNGDPHTMHFPTAVDPSNDIYYAVYAPARSADALTTAIATKMRIVSTSIIRTTVINKRGLRLALDDDFVREMLDTQDMRVAVREMEFQNDHDTKNMGMDKRSSGLELFLAF